MRNMKLRVNNVEVLRFDVFFFRKVFSLSTFFDEAPKKPSRLCLRKILASEKLIKVCILCSVGQLKIYFTETSDLPFQPDPPTGLHVKYRGEEVRLAKSVNPSFNDMNILLKRGQLLAVNICHRDLSTLQEYFIRVLHQFQVGYNI